MIREARPEDAAAIAHVHTASWRTTYRGIVPDDVLANLSEERRELMWARTLVPESAEFAYVAEDDAGQIIGFASGGPEREGDPVYTGELYAIYLLEAAQGKGTGRALLTAVREQLARKGHAAMILWVLAENPACRFYAALGGVPLRETTVEMGGASLREIAFGWAAMSNEQ